MYRCNRKKRDVTYEDCWECWLKEMRKKYPIRKSCVDCNAEKIDILNNPKKEVESGTSVSKTNS